MNYEVELKKETTDLTTEQRNRLVMTIPELKLEDRTKVLGILDRGQVTKEEVPYMKGILNVIPSNQLTEAFTKETRRGFTLLQLMEMDIDDLRGYLEVMTDSEPPKDMRKFELVSELWKSLNMETRVGYTLDRLKKLPKDELISLGFNHGALKTSKDLNDIDDTFVDKVWEHLLKPQPMFLGVTYSHMEDFDVDDLKGLGEYLNVDTDGLETEKELVSVLWDDLNRYGNSTSMIKYNYDQDLFEFQEGYEDEDELW